MIYSNSERSEQVLDGDRMLFNLFSDLIYKLEQLEFKLEKNIGI